MASTVSTIDQGMRCPDPSAHQTKNSALQNQASAAALYSTNPANTSNVNPLGPDGKLSSASAATSIRYARAQDLPGFPVVGIDTKSSAGTAALLAHQNQKSLEGWKPVQSSAAGKAALLANDYRMAPSWQPEASSASSKAALLAHRDGGKVNAWSPEASSAGNSAANIAFRNKAQPPKVDHGYSDQNKKNAFTAATGAHSASGRKRSQSNPAPVPLYPDSRNSARNALSAATLAHSPSVKAKPQAVSTVEPKGMASGAMEAARIQHAKSVSREMYTSTPPVALETDERKHNDALRASAISMAKKMYTVQQNNDGAASQAAARSGATTAHGHQPATSEADLKQQAMRYIGIQEAAQKLAQERLAKIGYDESAAYRSYYGYEQPVRSKLSMRRGRNRAQSASEPATANDSDSDEDDFRSRRIRSQMEHLNKQVADLDAKKRDTDRKSLLAAAQRKVQAQMQAQDKKIYDETGKMSPAMIEEWDEKARKRALANSEVRMETHGKVHIGNGKWMDQEDINAIALARIQPTLDEITEKTEKRRAEDERRRAEEEERRLDMMEKKRREKIEKERAADIKAEEKHAKEEEKRQAKLRASQEKEAAKQEKEIQKAKQTGESRLTMEEQRKVKEEPVAGHPADAAVASNDNDDLYRDPTRSDQAQHTTEHESDTASPTSPNSSKGFKSLFNKLKRNSKHSPSTETEEESKETAPGFVGGAALHSSTPPNGQQSSKDAVPTHHDTDEDVRPTNLGDVEPLTAHERYIERFSEVSSLSSDYVEAHAVAAPVVHGATLTSEKTELEEAKDHVDQDLVSPPNFTSGASTAMNVGSLGRDSKFHEIGI